MAGMGPPPKLPSQRRRPNANGMSALVLLPAEGRQGDPPTWPMGQASEAETKLWTELWATPQAAAWERASWTRVVARYVRLLIAAETPKAPAAILAEVRQLEDRLGLSPMAMLRLRWTTAANELEDRQPAPQRKLRAVDPGAVERAG